MSAKKVGPASPAPRVDGELQECTQPKVIFDGHVAVLLMNCYGTGWQDAGGDRYDPEVVLYRLGLGERPTVNPRNSIYDRCVDTVSVVWVPLGQAFTIHEYDGSESLRFLDLSDWHYVAPTSQKGIELSAECVTAMRTEADARRAETEKQKKEWEDTKQEMALRLAKYEEEKTASKKKQEEEEAAAVVQEEEAESATPPSSIFRVQEGTLCFRCGHPGHRAKNCFSD